ncbi:hypothetical protein IJG28_00195 [Candidatus Saccharibacteria bacterium]|nr:hypothetical protein [Candidatus Saccharibacteria bacterium]
MSNACTYKSCWDEFESIRFEYLELRAEATKAGETLAQFASIDTLELIQDRLETLLEESGTLQVTAREHLQSAATSLLHSITTVLCDAYMFRADSAADFDLYAMQEVEVK